jgi:hypothetical protein
MVSGRYTDSGTRKYCEVLKSTRAVLRISQFFLVPLTIYRPDIIVRNINYPFCWSGFEAKRRDNMKGICSQCDAYRYIYVQYFQNAFAIAIYKTLEVTKGFGRCGFPYTFVAYVVGNREGSASEHSTRILTLMWSQRYPSVRCRDARYITRSLDTTGS